jgi:membrane-associated phospholipid phosphatase
MGQVLSAGASVLLFAIPDLADINRHPPQCVPCDPGTLPWFDRVAARKQNKTLSDLSTLLELGLVAATFVDLGQGGGGKATAMSLEAATWTAAATEWSKTLIGRSRPVLYTQEATLAADDIDSQRSMPSGHTAVAFSLATSYALYTWDRREGHAGAALAGATAVTIGALRVLAGRHFVSDVLVGALLGTAMGVIAYEIRY